MNGAPWERLSRAKYGVLAAAALVVVVAGAVAVTGAVDLPGGEEPDPPYVLSEVTIGPSLYPDQPPRAELTPEEIERAHALASAHPLVQQARAGAELPFAETGVWTENGAKVGALVVLRLPAPIDMDAVWPIIRRPSPTPEGLAPSGTPDPVPQPDYTRDEVVRHEPSVAEINIWVDLRSDQVVEVFPLNIYTNN